MHQKRRTPVHIRAQQAEAFIRGVPRLHDDVVQLVAEKVLDHAFVARINFQKIRQHANRRRSALKHSGLKQSPHRLCGIAVFGNDGFQRATLAQSRSELCAQSVQMLLGFGFLAAFVFEQLASLSNFLGQG